MHCLQEEGPKMSFIRYNETGEIIEVIVRDGSGAKIESYRFRVSDKQNSIRIFRLLKSKYGFEVAKSKRDKDLDWLGKTE